MMDSLNTRILLGLALIFLGVTLYGKWQEEHAPEAPPQQVDVLEHAPQTNAQPQNNSVPDDSVPDASMPAAPAPKISSVSDNVDPSRLIHVQTDVFDLKIDKRGGDIVALDLKQYPKTKETPDDGFTLLSRSDDRYYIAQSGLLGANGPDTKQGRATYISSSNAYTLDGDTLNVELFWKNDEGVEFTKTYAFKRDSYLIDVSYDVENRTNKPFAGKLYGQIQRKKLNAKGKGMIGMQTYQGAAAFTPDKKFKKISYSDMSDEPFKQTIKGGWAGMVEHYFLSAWIPDSESQNDYYTSVLDNEKYNIGVLTALHVPAASKGSVQGQLYLGPEITDVLEGISPGLELTVDYGILWPISQLIFWVMKHIYGFVGNWGWAIILTTILIKAIFFKLSAASYRSMGHLRRVQPKIEQMKERFGDDKQRFSQAMMELYRKEKINPLGGCLPILVQIPVFIALYYVLLESVELRQAPFMFWLQDLSSKDPYYVLPLLMGGSMLVQQKLSPAPPDPMQAKMLMLMPIVFTFLFLSFPAGLVLYWVANNLLSIAQQWVIMRKLEKEGLGHRKPNKSKAKKA